MYVSFEPSHEALASQKEAAASKRAAQKEEAQVVGETSLEEQA